MKNKWILAGVAFLVLMIIGAMNSPHTPPAPTMSEHEIAERKIACNHLDDAKTELARQQLRQLCPDWIMFHR
jgi:hypothetical protein